MSLRMDTVAESDFVASAWLVAVTCTYAGVGRSAGAVYTPPEDMDPTAAFPPATPFTLQLTLVSVAFVTVAANAARFPSTTDPLAGVTLTSMEGGGGGGGTPEPAPPLPQPSVHAPVVRRAATTNLVVQDFLHLFCRRGCIPHAKQAKGQRMKRGPLSGIRRHVSKSAIEEVALNQQIATP
jgi:hypothetical protein